MVIFHSHVSLPEGTLPIFSQLSPVPSHRNPSDANRLAPARTGASVLKNWDFMSQNGNFSAANIGAFFQPKTWDSTIEKSGAL